MRAAGKYLLFAGFAVLLTAAAMSASVQAAGATNATGSITITPAAIQLELLKGASVATATVSITNNYTAAVDLHFTLDKSRQNAGGPDTARPYIALHDADLTVAAGQTRQQVITLNDAAAIMPGSQSVDMVVTHGGLPGQGIGVLPSMRLPVTVIKQDGAITSLGLTKIAGPSVAVRIPSTVDVILHNTGNMVAIPRGVVTVAASDGTVLASGVLNGASAAVSPGADIRLHTKLTKLGSATMPGAYNMHVTYGLGGDTAAANADKRFIYIAWWQPLAVLALVAAAWYLVVRRDMLYRSKKHRRSTGTETPTKRPLLIGRHIT